MGGSTISTSDTRVEALTLQSSAVGVTIPVVYGTNRIPGNMLWYGGFKAIPHTTSQSSGKGGGVKTQNTTYTYTASVAMGVCHGPIARLATVWRDKEVVTGGAYVGSPINVFETFTPTATYPNPWCNPVTVAHAAAFYAPVSVGIILSGGLLAEGADYTRVGGVYTFAARLSGRAITIQYQYGAVVLSQTTMQKIGATLHNGTMNQTASAWMTSTYPTYARNYPAMAYIDAQDYDLGTGAKVQNHSFEVEGIGAYSISSTIPDVDPSVFCVGILSNGIYGARMPSAACGDMTTFSAYCMAAGLLMSPTLTKQERAADVITQLATLTNTAAVWSVTKLKMIPFGDQTLTGNGKTYTPNVTPIYDLTDDHFMASGSEDPVRQVRKEPSGLFNHFRVAFKDRNNYYNDDIEEAADDANITTFGRRTADTIDAPWITTRAVARLVAQLQLQRTLNVQAQYEFTLPWSFELLEPMDLVTITDPVIGTLYPVRIVLIEEADDGFKITAEDFPLGVATASAYPSQSSAGFLHDYTVSPGSVATPVFFEAPVTLPSTGLEVYAAVGGVAAAWGGCNVWVSLDGLTYKRVQTLWGGARYGKLTSVVGSTVGITTTGAINNASAADSAAFTSLCYVGGASPEYIGYTSATLTGAGAYTLGGLTRGGYSTVQSAHAVNDPFVRIDDAIAKTGALDLSMIGKSIYVKFTSFNVYGSAEESLATVTAYSYVVTGAMVMLPPSTPASISASIETVGVRLNCSRNPEPDVIAYEWRTGATWATATVLERNGGTSYLWGMQTAGTYTVWVAARDFFGNFSAPISTTVSIVGGSVASLSGSIVAADLVLLWSGVQGSFAIVSYELRFGLTYATATSINTATVTRFSRRCDWVGLQRWWVTPIDVQGNPGTPASIDITITAPGAVTPGNAGHPSAEVIDNNVLLYWTAPSTGSLPIDRYEVRKGASWAAGATVGSNGNSTFTAVFEQAAGTFTYWVTAFDSAGNIGTPASIVATMSQPPDYILRSNIDSTFTGTKSNVYLDSGALYGPVDTTATWATHFSTPGWANIDAQITAGYPSYFEPSATSGFYEETFDYGATLPATTVTATLNSTLITGAVTATPLISWKLNVGDAWTNLASGVSSALISNFRYVKVRYDLAATGGLNLLRINGINVKLSVKLRSDSGSGTAVASTGVAVTFGYPFISADTPIVQPQGATPLIPVVIYSGGVNPTGFTVHLYNLAGTDVGGAFSWTVRGY